MPTLKNFIKSKRKGERGIVEKEVGDILEALSETAGNESTESEC